MHVEFAGTETVAAPIKTVWEHLLDADFVASCAPGVDKVERIDDLHYRVVAMLGVSSIQLRFSIKLQLTDLVPPTSARMLVQGNAPGSTMSAVSAVTLTETGPRSTNLAWTVGADVRGTVASTGARLLQGTAKKLTQKFWTTFAKRAPKK